MYIYCADVVSFFKACKLKLAFSHVHTTAATLWICEIHKSAFQKPAAAAMAWCWCCMTWHDVGEKRIFDENQTWFYSFFSSFGIMAYPLGTALITHHGFYMWEGKITLQTKTTWSSKYIGAACLLLTQQANLSGNNNVFFSSENWSDMISSWLLIFFYLLIHFLLSFLSITHDWWHETLDFTLRLSLCTTHWQLDDINQSKNAIVCASNKAWYNKAQ